MSGMIRTQSLTARVSRGDYLRGNIFFAEQCPTG